MTIRRHSLETATLRVEVDPTHGGVLHSLQRRSWAGWTDVLMPHRTPNAPDPTNSACFTMLPWCNRLSAGGVLGPDGLRTIAPNWPTTPYPVHGIGWLTPWTLTFASPSALTLHQSYRDGDPYSFDAEMRITLSCNSLTLAVEVTNASRTILPFGIGFHPYFPKSPETMLRLEAASANGFNPMGLPLPTGPIPDSLDFSEGRVLDRGDLSVFFQNADSIEISNGRSKATCQIRTTGCPHAHLWVPEGQPYFCIEPLSHKVDAFSAAATSVDHWLSPGEQVSASMTLVMVDTIHPVDDTCA